MRFRAPSLVAVILTAFFGVALSGAMPALAQPTAPLPPRELSAPTDDTVLTLPGADGPAPLDAALEHGKQLESEGRWGEAILHYDDSLRQFPKNDELHQSRAIARLHYDLGRRYADPTFLDAASSLSRDDALRLCREVLTKIETHHVDQPSWRGILNHGTLNFEVALIDPAFLEKNLLQTETAQINAFRRELRERLDAVRVENREEALEAVNVAAWLGSQRLGLRESTVVLEYLCGTVNMLDDYSSFLTRGELGEVHAQIEGNFVGLGIELRPTENGLEIIRAISGSPAATAGIRSGDVILEVDGFSATDGASDKAADMLQGPVGSYVNVVVKSVDQQPRTLQVRRDHVAVPSVEDAKIIDAERGIAYFRMTSFQKTTSREMDDALWNLHRAGMMSLIIDLRGNPGGLLTASVEAADKFVTAGVIVSTRGRHPGEDYTHRARPGSTWHVPLTVLIDQDSASASEIFAGAIRDHKRGTIVGTRSYGKGSVQGIFSLDTGGTGIRLTTAKFYSPVGHPFSKVGVSPDVEVRTAAKPINGRLPITSNSDDPFVSAGLQVARERMAQRSIRNGSR
ncbi:MAG: S41 family peptidase [Pirellulales bacterium]|nr:S41 family peptidase [Pirellulales bacterium]